MSDKIRELKAIFNSFDPKGQKEKIEDCLQRFESGISTLNDATDCKVAVLWMKNIFFQDMGDFAGAEALLEEALEAIEASPAVELTKWKLKIYLSLGYIHLEQYNFIDAEFFFSKALDLAVAHTGLKNFLGEIYARLAEVSIHLNRYAQAKKYVTREKKAAYAVYKAKSPAEKGAALGYAYSLIDFCRIKRIIGLVDHTLSDSIEDALSIFVTQNFTKGILRAKLESAQLLLELNFTDRALFMIQGIEPTFQERQMYKECITAGLLIAKFHKKMLDYSLAESKLSELVDLSRKQNLSNALIMADVYYEMGLICYETDREEKAMGLFKSSAKIGMLAGVKRYIFRAFDAARLVDKKEAKVILSSDLVYQDAAFIRNRMAGQTSPFHSGNQKRKLFASTLFVDIAGFSALMKDSDETTTVQMIDELMDRICVIIFRNRGYIDKFLGDGFMAIFEHGDQAEADIAVNAIRAGIEINRAIHTKNMRFKEAYGMDREIIFRMGISTGEIYALFLGNFIKREFTFLGNAVNLASKLEARADQKGLLMDETTHTLVSDRVAGDPRELDIPGLGRTKAYSFRGFAHKEGVDPAFQNLIS
ncbi:MAG: adenylate/guanylate cyclase domain-containing protein [Desulfobacter sp.]|nr:MAG: adenylate/guanylate cyclase domain-containing protein [Desulfobacter sp.]